MASLSHAETLDAKLSSSCNSYTHCAGFATDPNVVTPSDKPSALKAANTIVRFTDALMTSHHLIDPSTSRGFSLTTRQWACNFFHFKAGVLKARSLRVLLAHNAFRCAGRKVNSSAKVSTIAPLQTARTATSELDVLRTPCSRPGLGVPVRMLKKWYQATTTVPRLQTRKCEQRVWFDAMDYLYVPVFAQ